METIKKQEYTSPSWIRGSTRRGREFEWIHKQKFQTPSSSSSWIHLCPFAFVTRRIEYKHLRCAQNKTYYELNLNFFQLFLCLCKFNRSSKFKRILNANTHSIRITNADGQGGVLKPIVKQKNMRWEENSSVFKKLRFSNPPPLQEEEYITNAFWKK